MPIGYVVFWSEHLRDGTEEGARCYETLEGALEGAGELLEGFNRHNLTVRVFTMGEEIPIVVEEVKEPQPPKVVKMVVKRADIPGVPKKSLKRE